MAKNNEKLIFRAVLAVSVFVFVLVIVLNKKILPVPDSIPSFIYRLPAFNALINGTCFFLLLISFYMIKNKRISAHKKLNITTFCLSSLFLISYITYHWLAVETTYGGSGAIRNLYYFVLISHIVLSAFVLPLVLLSFYYGLNNNVPKHRKVVRWTFPIWLYVTLSGVVVYLMISPYYPVPN